MQSKGSKLPFYFIFHKEIPPEIWGSQGFFHMLILWTCEISTPPQLGKEKSFHPVQSFHPVNISVLACTPLLADLGSNRPSFMAIYWYVLTARTCLGCLRRDSLNKLPRLHGFFSSNPSHQNDSKTPCAGWTLSLSTKQQIPAIRWLMPSPPPTPTAGAFLSHLTGSSLGP